MSHAVLAKEILSGPSPENCERLCVSTVRSYFVSDDAEPVSLLHLDVFNREISVPMAAK